MLNNPLSEELVGLFPQIAELGKHLPIQLGVCLPEFYPNIKKKAMGAETASNLMNHRRAVIKKEASSKRQKKYSKLKYPMGRRCQT